jgi:hypothetical protein
MPRWGTDLIELAVGLACLLAAGGLRSRSGVLALLLAVAGVAVH